MAKMNGVYFFPRIECLAFFNACSFIHFLSLLFGQLFSFNVCFLAVGSYDLKSDPEAIIIMMIIMMQKYLNLINISTT